jgi:D-glycero-alpha-D-manno-heptose-7-phosphate kinase
MLVHTVFQRQYRMKYSRMEEVDKVEDIAHPILRETLTRHWKGNPLEIASIADVPSGTGLGSSGAYTVCLLKSLAHAKRTSITPGALAEAACEIEIDVLGEPVGKQDQYVSAHGGICAFTFKRDDSVEVEPLALDAETLRALRDQLLLFFTGEARSSSAILSHQDMATRARDGAMVDSLDRTKQLGMISRSLLESGKLVDYALTMHEHWERKRRRSPGMTNDRIDALYATARRNGAIGGKLVGAGGGGFLLLYTERPEETRKAMAELGAPELEFDFEFSGAQSTEYR